MSDPSTDEKCTDVTFRLATTADAPAIATILSDSFKEYKERYTQEALVASAPPVDRVLERIEEGPTWVAEHDGEIIGTVSAVPRGKELRLRGLAVPPCERGKAIGRQLLVQLGRYAIKNHFNRISVVTNPFLTRAIREYEHFGFERSEEKMHDFHGTEAYTMTKHL